jgi:hypothetical protein
MGKFVVFQYGLNVLPVTEDDLAAFTGRELVTIGECHRGLLPHIDLHRGLLLRCTDVFNNLLCVHTLSPSGFVKPIVPSFFQKHKLKLTHKSKCFTITETIPSPRR